MGSQRFTISGCKFSTILSTEIPVGIGNIQAISISDLPSFIRVPWHRMHTELSVKQFVSLSNSILKSPCPDFGHHADSKLKICKRLLVAFHEMRKCGKMMVGSEIAEVIELRRFVELKNKESFEMKHALKKCGSVGDDDDEWEFCEDDDEGSLEWEEEEDGESEEDDEDEEDF